MSVDEEYGFSLIELMTIVAVVGVVAALAVPDLLALSRRMQIDLFARELASELRQAKQLAMTQRDRVYLTVDRGQRAILAQVGTARVPHHIFSYAERAMELDEPSAGPELVFHPSGRSATATTIRFHNAQGENGALTVSLTGRVSIQ
ncbi:MAG: GspH/FimT family pseudopilin [Nitrospira sp.]|nr:GspH/FimT family pseudopilin [Nitrospira sp.]